MDRIAVLIPCFNEEQTIAKVIDDWRNTLPEAVIYVYNNNSTDDTVKLAREHGAVVRNEYMQGKGNVIRRMFLEINAECYILVDGDDTYPAEAGPAMVNAVLEDGADMVVGDRLSSTYFTENKRPLHNFGNCIIRGIINRMFKTEIRDIMTGYRAFSYRFVKSFPAISDGFEIETEMTMHAIDKNMCITNQIVDYRDRPHGSSSKLKTVPDGIKVISKMIHLYCDYRPAQFFGIIAAVMMILALILFIPVFTEYLHTGLVPKIPTLVTSGFMVIAAIISMFAGLILANIRHKERREFEFRLQAINNWYEQHKNQGSGDIL